MDDLVRELFEEFILSGQLDTNDIAYLFTCLRRNITMSKFDTKKAETIRIHYDRNNETREEFGELLNLHAKYLVGEK